MAQALRVGPGQYTVNGKRYNAPDSQTALKMAGAAGKPQQQNQNHAQPGGPVAPGNLHGAQRQNWYQQNNPTAPGAQATNQVVAQDGNAVADQSFDLAMNSIKDPNNQIGTAFNPQLTQRLSNGDLMANRQKVEDAVYGRLTANNAKNKAFDSNALEQNLYNRGIPYTPDDPQRQRWTQALDQRYDNLDQQARQDAIDRADSANAAEVQLNEGMRTNDYNIQQGTNQTQVGNFNSLAGTGNATGTTVINNAATLAGIDALKKKTPAEIAALNRSNQRPAGSNASSTQNAFG